MTQPELAKAAGVPLRTLKAWEKERQPLAFDTAMRLARALGVGLDELAGVHRPPPSPERAPEVIVNGVPYYPSDASSDQPYRELAIEGSGASASGRGDAKAKSSRPSRKRRRA